MYYLNHSWEDKGIYTFPNGICPKVNVKARLEFELAYYGSAVQRFNHYTTNFMYVLSIKVPMRKKSGNLLYASRDLKATLHVSNTSHQSIM